MSEKKKPEDGSRQGTSYLEKICQIFLHVISMIPYFIPLYWSYGDTGQILDESHVLSSTDTLGTSPFWDILQNDYWGRHILNFESSHKSWRPLSIYLCRLLSSRNVEGIDDLLFHRLVSIIIHAGLAEMISQVALRLHPKMSSDNKQRRALKFLTKFLFALHPTHVEAVINVANRPHVLALIFSILTLELSLPLLCTPILCALALMTCETAIFHFPPLMVTLTVIVWKQKHFKKDKRKPLLEEIKTLLSIIFSLLPNHICIAGTGIAYYVARWYLNTLDIPDGLIRPAENPFYRFEGTKRFFSYLYVLGIHISKSFLYDPIGFSHEYGFDCVPAADSFEDSRLLLNLLIGALMVFFLVVSLRSSSFGNVLDVLVALSWLTTLFPISGIVKVGTFIADRIIVPSSISCAIYGGYLLTSWIHSKPSEVSSGSKSGTISRVLKWGVIFAGFSNLSYKVMYRGYEWTDAYRLLESSYRACPNSAKTNMEMAKCLNGMYPERLDLDLSLKHVARAQEIDPSYCDVHEQFAIIEFQRNNYLEFEGNLTKAVVCQFTMKKAMNMWQQYWKAVTQDPFNGNQARLRMQKHLEFIEQKRQEEMIRLGESPDDKETQQGRDEL